MKSNDNKKNNFEREKKLEGQTQREQKLEKHTHTQK